MLENFLQKIEPQQFVEMSGLEDFQLGKQLSIYEDRIPNLKGIQLAIIGVGKVAANAVRSYLYQLTNITPTLKIADLGNLAKPTNEVLIPVIKELLDSQIFPIIIGNQHHFTLAQYQAYHLREQLVNLVVIDKTIDFTFDKVHARRNINFFNKILQQDQSYLLHLGLIGYQSHFINPRILQFFENQQFDYMRLGHIRAQLEETEPIIRDADLLSFDISVIRQSEVPATRNPSPSGLFSEEACKMAHYAGLSNKLTSIGFYGFNTKDDLNGQTVHLVAQMIWYFLDGFANRKEDYPINTDGLTEYLVDFKNSNYQISFWKSKRSERWWMQIPVKSRSQKYDRHRLIPCSYNDYLMASREELPERLVNAYSRFS
ncbi:MAG: arginase family protein [Saprospiraceae bacterium]